MEKLCKRDRVFLGIALVIALAGILWFFFGYSTPGAMVEITVDGEIIGTYPLAEEREISIPTENGKTNRLMIAKGQASMLWADCPDQICVNHKAVSHGGEEIVCLPNRVVVRILEEGGNGNREPDAIAK